MKPAKTIHIKKIQHGKEKCEKYPIKNMRLCVIVSFSSPGRRTVRGANVSTAAAALSSGWSETAEVGSPRPVFALVSTGGR